MISIEKYLEGIESIYIEQPSYALGHDGSDGKCDCIGMVKGAIKRGGGSATGLSGTNYAARFTIKNLQKIVSSSQLKVGQVVLKASDPSASGYALPDKYRAGGKNYTGDLLDYYHIGTVTKVYPLEITHMTSPKPKKDTKLGKWAFFGDLPQVSGEVSPAPSPAPSPEPSPEQPPTLRRGDRGEYVTLAQVKLTEKGCPCGEIDGVFGQKTEEAVRSFQWREGIGVDGIIGKQTWGKLLQANEPAYFTVFIDGLTEAEADELVRRYPNATKGRG